MLLFSHSVVSNSATPWTIALQAFLNFTNSQSLLKLMSIESDMTYDHLILCYPLLLTSIFPSIRVFSNELGLCMRWPKYWSFSFSIPFNEYSGSISFRMDWLDLLAVQGTLKSLLQHHSSKASILRCSAFFTIQLSHPYMTTGKMMNMKMKVKFSQSCPTLCNPMAYSLWSSPGCNTGVASLSLLQGIFPIQGSNSGLLHCSRVL